MTVYLDSNVFIYAVTEHEISEASRQALGKIEKGESEAATSVLTVDEVVWIVQNQADRSTGIETGRRLLEMKNLEILDLEAGISLRSLELMENTDLNPRDSLHAASALENRVYSVVSSDKDLEGAEDIERVTVEEFARSAGT